MTANLILHRGARLVSRDELLTVPTPARTQSWVPIPHSRLLDGVQTAMERSALRVVSERHGLTSDGNRYFGLLELSNDSAGSWVSFFAFFFARSCLFVGSLSWAR